MRCYERVVGGTVVLECGECCALVFADDERADWRQHVAWHETVNRQFRTLFDVTGP